MNESSLSSSYLNNIWNIRLVFYAVCAVSTILLLYIALITSWISDDAQITFRQVLNFISGDGIVFNFGERVQAFTHPLWFFLLSGVIAITGEMYVSTSILSIVIALAAVLTLLKLEFSLAKSGFIYISPIFYFVFSFAFCDYMTSGLENPLSYLLVSLLFLLLYGVKTRKRLQLIFIVLALLVLNRFDFVILFLPLVLVSIYSNSNKSELIGILLPGTLLLVTWLIFATLYFGSPLPNTFYAKLNAGFPQSEIFERGINYLKSLQFDIASIVIMALSFLSLILYRDRLLISLIIGKVLYVCYIVYIGGDFMLGRYFAILVFLSIGEIIVAVNKSSISLSIKNIVSLICLLSFVVIGYFYSSPVFASTDHQMRAVYQEINDQRGAYYRFTGLFAKERQRWPKPERFAHTAPKDYRIICGLVGATALTDITEYHIDPCGLTDPFLQDYQQLDMQIGELVII